MATTSDAPVRARICAHMNKDHTPHLQLYSQHYLHFPPRTPTKCLDISLTHLTLSTGIIPLDPPMTSLSDSRTTLKLMVYDCQESLPDQPTPYKLTRIAPPSPSSILLIFLCLLLTYIYLTPETSLVPGGWVQQYLFFGQMEWLRAGMVRWGGVWILVGLWGGHALEVLALVLPELKAAEAEGSVYWVWALMGFMEGFPAVRRLRAAKRRVRREVRGEEKAEKKKA